MDVVLVGLPATGKSEVGRRLATALGGTFVDTDREVERLAGRRIETIFREDGEAAFRALDRSVVAAIPAPDASRPTVIATGGGTVVDPRNRRWLYAGRRVLWLDAPDDVLATRLRRSPIVRPLLASGDVDAGLARLRIDRARFYAAGVRIDAGGSIAASVSAATAAIHGGGEGTMLLRADLPIGRIALGEGIAAAVLDTELRRLEARRAVVVSEPRAWAAVGRALGEALRGRGWRVDLVELPEGEGAKRLAIVERAAGELIRIGLERGEPIVALGGGALTDAAGFIAATIHRGSPWIAVPTTLVAQLDAALGGKTAVDLPEGKNLVGAFHLPVAVIVDPTLAATVAARHRRAALAEAVKAGALGDERLLEALEDEDVEDPAVLAEILERAMWLKVATVLADPTEQGERIALNLGHTLGHAIEAASGFGPVLHGEAVAYGLRAAARIGRRTEVTPPGRAARIEAILDRLGLAVDALPCPLQEVLAMLESDKKRRSGRQRWVLPTADGWALASDVPDELVREVAAGVLAGRTLAAGAR